MAIVSAVLGVLPKVVDGVKYVVNAARGVIHKPEPDHRRKHYFVMENTDDLRPMRCVYCKTVQTTLNTNDWCPYFK
jgi:hypothetical protein